MMERILPLLDGTGPRNSFKMSPMSNTTRPRPVVLCVLDGWGEREERDGNAVVLARTPVWNRMKAACPHARLDASEHHVGRSEEHTSELQSLMRISYAVFCLKKKTTRIRTLTRPTYTKIK